MRLKNPSFRENPSGHENFSPEQIVLFFLFTHHFVPLERDLIALPKEKKYVPARAAARP